MQITNESNEAFEELGRALRAVHDRLIAEGYTIVDGKYVLPKS